MGPIVSQFWLQHEWHCLLQSHLSSKTFLISALNNCIPHVTQPLTLVLGVFEDVAVILQRILFLWLHSSLQFIKTFVQTPHRHFSCQLLVARPKPAGTNMCLKSPLCAHKLVISSGYIE